ncbi:MAG TPA: hypothetical protein VL242_29570, partial [Sorangium sp.]|nr:hypothetical protein [Sorangium sp.]
ALLDAAGRVQPDLRADRKTFDDRRRRGAHDGDGPPGGGGGAGGGGRRSNNKKWDTGRTGDDWDDE